MVAGYFFFKKDVAIFNTEIMAHYNLNISVMFSGIVNNKIKITTIYDR